MDSSRLQRRRIFTFVTLFLVIAALATAFFTRLSDARKEGPRGPAPDMPEPTAALLKPAPPSQGFVGSAACAECHQEIAGKYARHPMGRSLTTLADATPLEDYSRSSFSPLGYRRYRAEKTAEGVVHCESLVDLQGELLYDQQVPVSYVLGSGQHGRAYLIQRDGLFFQSSIGWYAQGGRWDLSPGYKPAVHNRFERQIGDGCLYCHAGRMAENPQKPGRYAANPFQEASIGCERCHGPGKEHIDHQRLAKAKGPDSTIVNPGRLDPARREAVCNQCHLQGEKVVLRYGRGFFDFRPGQYLDDTLIVLVHGQRIDDQKRTLPVSQVEQMRASKCYEASGKQLGCISCHDPHEDVAPDQRDSFYRDRCVQCHADRGCSVPEAERRRTSAADACAHCHMPALKTKDVAHTSLTDHRILRRPNDAKTHKGLPLPDEIQLFDGAEQRLSKREADRARALAIIDIAVARKDQGWASRGEQYLVPHEVSHGTIDQMIDALGDDSVAIEALGQAYLVMERPREAIRCWERVVKLSPYHQTALVQLAFQYQDAEDWPKTLQFLDRALQINPQASILTGRRTYVLGQLGRLEDGVVAAKRAVEADPTLTQPRQWLAETYGKLGKPAESAEQHSLSERMQATFQRETTP